MRRKAKIAASVLLAAGLITGCSSQAGVAATVNGETITVQEVDEGMALGPYYAAQVAPVEIIMNIIQARVLIDAAGAAGMGVSEAEAAAFLDAVGAQNIQVEGEYTAPVLDLARMSLLSEQVSGNPAQGQQVVEAVNGYMTEADIELNPRYGVWDLAEGGLDQSPPEWVQY